MLTAVLRRLPTWIVVALALLLSLPTAFAASPELLLDDSRPQNPAWPAVMVRGDPGHALTLDEIRREPQAFAAPAGPEGNLGPRQDTVWVRLLLRVADSDGRWVFDLDYPSIHEAELYLVGEGELILQRRLGAVQPFAQRPLPSRSHAAPLPLSAGKRYELYLRVRTPSAMVLPLSLLKPEQHQLREYRVQLVQGLIMGIAVTLLVYSLTHWWSLRNRLFGFYAVMICGSSVFFLVYFGIAQQHFWNEQTSLTLRLAPTALLLALAAGGQFVAHALDTRRNNPWLHRGLALVSAGSVAAFFASLLGLFDYRATQISTTVLGLLLMLQAVPAAWSRARRRDPTGIYMLLGWTSYLLGSIAMAGLLRGLLPASVWSQHSFQWGWLAEMLVWIRVLGLNIESVRRAAEQAELEKKSLESLARTDALTGLPNRRGLNAALADALLAGRPDTALAVYLLDLDGFKAINDNLGHDAGDQLLVQVGQRLRQQLRRSDIVARLGGDEFVIVAGSLPGEAEAMMLGRKLLEAFKQPFTVFGQDCRVGLTIGFALAPQDGHDAAGLLKCADAAMYAGKQAGRHTVRRGAPALQTLLSADANQADAVLRSA